MASDLLVFTFLFSARLVALLQSRFGCHCNSVILCFWTGARGLLSAPRWNLLVQRRQCKMGLFSRMLARSKTVENITPKAGGWGAAYDPSPALRGASSSEDNEPASPLPRYARCTTGIRWRLLTDLHAALVWAAE